MTARNWLTSLETLRDRCTRHDLRLTFVLLESQFELDINVDNVADMLEDLADDVGFEDFRVKFKDWGWALEFEALRHDRCGPGGKVWPTCLDEHEMEKYVAQILERKQRVLEARSKIK